jgi:SAM-dependent methyltransferase
VIFGAIPAGCERALDVGCGTGRLTRELRRVIPMVTGVDRDERCTEVARWNAARSRSGDIEYRCGDVLDLPLAPGGFDVVTAVASLHHMETEVGSSGGGILGRRELARGSDHRRMRRTARQSCGRPLRPISRSAGSPVACCPVCATGVTCSGATRSAG